MEFARLANVEKDFSGVKALSGVSLSAHQGEVLALVGENGAGKSTLMNILSGVYPAGTYSGEIFIKGKAVSFQSPRDAEKAGITIIHQELSSFSHLTVAENMWVGHWPAQKGLVNWEQMFSNAKEWLARIGAEIDPHLSMNELSTGSQQLVEIAKSLSRNSELLIFDEPTSSLTPKEVARLFEIIGNLKSQNKAIIYISHKMEEIFALADRVTILRDGKSVATSLTSEITEGELIAKMVGRSLDRLFPPQPHRAIRSEEPVLRVTNFSAIKVDGTKHVAPISFELRRGEILGFGGLLGAGRTELVQALLGARSKYKVQGEVYINGKLYQPSSPRDAVRAQIGYVGEDRKLDSILASRSLNENSSISRLASDALKRILNHDREISRTEESLSKLRTKFHDQQQTIRELSGGNQQKVILARVLQTAPEIIILDEPTRGVDVGAKYEIYQLLFELAATGKSFIVVSSDLPELMALSDRVIVLSEGKMTGELNREQFSQEEIMRLAVQSAKVTA